MNSSVRKKTALPILPLAFKLFSEGTRFLFCVHPVYSTVSFCGFSNDASQQSYNNSNNPDDNDVHNNKFKPFQ